MTDEAPKDYSQMYDENHSSVTAKSRPKPFAKLDGSFDRSIKHREQGIDMRSLVEKLQKLPKMDGYAMSALNQHYSSIFKNKNSNYRAYIKYFDEKDTYVVSVERNTLASVKDKLPKRGNYRFFFKSPEDSFEEVEYDEADVPLYERNGRREIHCRVFSY